MENQPEKVEIEQKSEKPEAGLGIEAESPPIQIDDGLVQPIPVEDWQEAMFIQNTDANCFVSSQYILNFYTEFASKLEERYEQFEDDERTIEMAQKIKPMLYAAFEEKSIEAIEEHLGIKMTAPANGARNYVLIEPDYSLFYTMDCIARFTLAFGICDEPDKQEFALQVCDKFIERPRRFWPIFLARLFEQSPSAIPLVQHELTEEEKSWSLRVVLFYSRIMAQQKRSNHPNDIMMAGCWIRNAQAELAKAVPNFGDDFFFLDVILIFLAQCMDLILERPSDFTESLSEIKLSLIELDQDEQKVIDLMETIDGFEEMFLTRETGADENPGMGL